MQEFIDNIKSFGDFIGALISLFIFLITLPFKFLGWVKSNEIWFNSLPEWIQSTVAIAFFLLLILFLGLLIIGGVELLLKLFLFLLRFCGGLLFKFWFCLSSVLLRSEEYPSSEISERRKTLNEWEFWILMVPFIKCYQKACQNN